MDNTYHSDEWSKCKKYTLTMLILSVVLLWLLPINYSLFNSLIIAFICAYVLYLIGNETDEKKKALKPNNLPLHKSIYAMNKDELYTHCRNCGLDDIECKIAYYVVIEKLKGKELYEAIGYSEPQTKRKRTKILNLINK